MKRTNSLSDLLNAETQLIEALPKMVESSQSSALKVILEDNLQAAKGRARRLQDIFKNIGQDPKGVTCEAMKGFVAESEAVIHKIQEGPIRDSAIIGVVQRVQQYEIKGYKMAREHAAADLAHRGIVELLNETLHEEREINLRLNELAQNMINIQSINPASPEPKEFKNTDVSSFISDGNPNVQEPQEKGKDKGGSP